MINRNRSARGLLDFATAPGGLLAPPEEPPLPGLLAYADPSQDAEHLQWLMQPPKPYTPWIDLFDLERQLRMDPPQQVFPPEPQPKQRLIFPRDEW